MHKDLHYSMGAMSFLVMDDRHMVGMPNRPHPKLGIYLGRLFLYSVSHNLTIRGPRHVPPLARPSMTAHRQHQATLAKEHDIISTGFYFFLLFIFYIIFSIIFFFPININGY